jgi:hypothetical protein
MRFIFATQMWIMFPQAGQWSKPMWLFRRKGKGFEKRYEENDKTSSGCPTTNTPNEKTKRKKMESGFLFTKVTLPDDVV